jgi:hypothetical protein
MTIVFPQDFTAGALSASGRSDWRRIINGHLEAIADLLTVMATDRLGSTRAMGQLKTFVCGWYWAAISRVNKWLHGRIAKMGAKEITYDNNN